MAAQIHERTAFEHEDRSIPRLIRDFTHETTALLRDEVDLARSEVSEKISQLGRGLTYLGAGALVLFAGLLVLLDAAVVALAEAIPPDQAWLSPLIVGGVVAIIGAIMLMSGRSRFSTAHLKPERTIEETRRNKELLKERLS
jgi:hypothetical protein